jgi:hypothetical protein
MRTPGLYGALVAAEALGLTMLLVISCASLKFEE